VAPRGSTTSAKKTLNTVHLRKKISDIDLFIFGTYGEALTSVVKLRSRKKMFSEGGRASSAGPSRPGLFGWLEVGSWKKLEAATRHPHPQHQLVPCQLLNLTLSEPLSGPTLYDTARAAMMMMTDNSAVTAARSVQRKKKNRGK
jgi:hypothetical protein